MLYIILVLVYNYTGVCVVSLLEQQLKPFFDHGLMAFITSSLCHNTLHSTLVLLEVILMGYIVMVTWPTIWYKCVIQSCTYTLYMYLST